VKMLLRGRPGAARPGEAGPPAREPLRFRPAATLAFPTSDVESVEPIGGTQARAPGPASGGCPGGSGRPGDEAERWRVTVNFMGLYGPASPMPNHFTEEMLWAGPEEQGARDFVDLFNHRMISFVFRAWEKYRLPEQFRPEGPDPFTRRMFCLMGLGTDGMRETAGLEPLPLLASAALLSSRQRSAVGLEGLLRTHLSDVPVRVEPCVTRCVRIPEADTMRLGIRAARLGADACLGSSVSDRSGSFRVELGPMRFETFRSLLPHGERLPRLVRLVRLYLADPLDFEVALRLDPSDLPPLALAPERGLGLGHASWLSPTGRDEGRVRLLIRDLDPLPAAIPAEAPRLRSAAGGTTPTLASARR
jgi:type VI secretion system protein ImpH